MIDDFITKEQLEAIGFEEGVEHNGEYRYDCRDERGWAFVVEHDEDENALVDGIELVEDCEGAKERIIAYSLYVSTIKDVVDFMKFHGITPRND